MGLNVWSPYAADDDNGSVHADEDTRCVITEPALSYNGHCTHVFAEAALCICYKTKIKMIQN